MKGYIKTFVWGVVFGSIALLIFLFSTGWVLTKVSAKEMAQSAVLDRLSSISVAQFMRDPEREDRLKELKNLSYHMKREYVAKRGWATMPDEEEPDGKVSEECLRRLMEL